MKKETLYANAIWLLIGLAAGNFIYQAIVGQHWGIAADRSFFQALAIVTYCFLMQLREPPK